ncbi:MAG: hypothetical protein ACYDG2_23225 [Ruminiclostridium sp.]
MGSNKSRESSPSHKESDSKNENNKIPMQEHQQIEENTDESFDESYRKHKCKKNEFENSSFLEGLILLLLLKEIGLLDNEIDEDYEDKEFDANTKTKENIINQENINHENYETVQEKNKSKFDIDNFLDNEDKEFDANTKTNENIINQEKINNENHETVEEKDKSKSDMDDFLDDVQE